MIDRDNKTIVVDVVAIILLVGGYFAVTRGVVLGYVAVGLGIALFAKLILDDLRSSQ